MAEILKPMPHLSDQGVDKEVSHPVCDSESTFAPRMSPLKPASTHIIAVENLQVSREKLLKMVDDHPILHKNATLVRAVDCAVTAENRLTKAMEKACGRQMENLPDEQKKVLQATAFKAYKNQERTIGTYADLLKRNDVANLKSEEKAIISSLIERTESIFLEELGHLSPKHDVERSQLSSLTMASLRQQIRTFSKCRAARHRISHMSMVRGEDLKREVTLLREELANGLASVEMVQCQELVLIGLLMLEHFDERDMTENAQTVKLELKVQAKISPSEEPKVEEKPKAQVAGAKSSPPSKNNVQISIADKYLPGTLLTLVGPCRALGFGNPDKSGALSAITNEKGTKWIKIFSLPTSTTDYAPTYTCCLMKKSVGGVTQQGRSFDVHANESIKFLAWDGPPHFTVAIIGERGTGKTAFLMKLLTSNFDERYQATLSHDESGTIEFATNSNDTVTFTCRTSTSNFHPEAHAVLVMCDSSSKVSCDNVSLWISGVPEHIPIVVCLNKTDVTSGAKIMRKLRKLNFPCCEISVKKDENVAQPLLLLARQLTGDLELSFSAKAQTKCKASGHQDNLHPLGHSKDDNKLKEDVTRRNHDPD